MSNLTPTLPLSDAEKNWNGFAIKEHYRGELISLACMIGEEKKFIANFKKAFGKAPPEPNHMADIKGGFAMWTGQNQYMLLLSGENIQADIDCAAKFKGTAYATLQSDGWAAIDVKGEHVFDVLERFIPLELRRAPKNFAARTSAHHISVIVLKFSATEVYLLTPRSSARSFLEGLIHTAENVLSS